MGFKALVTPGRDRCGGGWDQSQPRPIRPRLSARRMTASEKSSECFIVTFPWPTDVGSFSQT